MIACVENSHAVAALVTTAAGRAHQRVAFAHCCFTRRRAGGPLAQTRPRATEQAPGSLQSRYCLDSPSSTAAHAVPASRSIDLRTAGSTRQSATRDATARCRPKRERCQPRGWLPVAQANQRPGSGDKRNAPDGPVETCLRSRADICSRLARLAPPWSESGSEIPGARARRRGWIWVNAEVVPSARILRLLTRGQLAGRPREVALCRLSDSPL